MFVGLKVNFKRVRISDDPRGPPLTEWCQVSDRRSGFNSDQPKRTEFKRQRGTEGRKRTSATRLLLYLLLSSMGDRKQLSLEILKTSKLFKEAKQRERDREREEANQRTFFTVFEVVILVLSKAFSHAYMLLICRLNVTIAWPTQSTWCGSRKRWLWISSGPIANLIVPYSRRCFTLRKRTYQSKWSFIVHPTLLAKRNGSLNKTLVKALHQIHPSA